MKKLAYLFIAAVLLCVSCKQEEARDKVMNQNDYEQYFSSNKGEMLAEAKAQVKFWSNRLRPDSSGVGDLGPLAAAYTGLYEATGDVHNLSHAETLYRKAISLSGDIKDGYERGLAHNLISQHRFKEAKNILEVSYAGNSNKHQTELMLFDVYMEVGEYENAYKTLSKVKNNSDYNYLIRAAKWNDFKGDLDATIQLMEKAKTIAESRKSKPLQIWTYSNLGDYYGHAGRIKDSYDHYLKTLALQPDNAYAKKGLAWIAYSWENNPKEANRILSEIEKDHVVPDYALMKSELAEFSGDDKIAETLKTSFLNEVSQPKFGDMYNAYQIELYADTDAKKSLEMAKAEVANRPTPEAYHLLALAQLKNNQKGKALSTINDHVAGKTYEPMAQYHMGLVYNAHGKTKEVKELKEELLGAAYELGPMLTAEIEKW